MTAPVLKAGKPGSFFEKPGVSVRFQKTRGILDSCLRKSQYFGLKISNSITSIKELFSPEFSVSLRDVSLRMHKGCDLVSLDSADELWLDFNIEFAEGTQADLGKSAFSYFLYPDSETDLHQEDYAQKRIEPEHIQINKGSNGKHRRSTRVSIRMPISQSERDLASDGKIFLRLFINHIDRKVEGQRPFEANIGRWHDDIPLPYETDSFSAGSVVRGLGELFNRFLGKGEEAGAEKEAA